MLVLVPLSRTDCTDAAMQVLSSTVSGLVFQETCTDIQQALSKIWALLADCLTKNSLMVQAPGFIRAVNLKSKI
jgi:hypothetical protein